MPVVTLYGRELSLVYLCQWSFIWKSIESGVFVPVVTLWKRWYICASGHIIWKSIESGVFVPVVTLYGRDGIFVPVVTLYGRELSLVYLCQWSHYMEEN